MALQFAVKVEASLDTKSSTYFRTPLENVKEGPSIEEISGILIFGQLEAIFPAAGMAYRIRSSYIGVEASTSIVFVPPVAFKAAVSILFFSNNQDVKKWYVGIGAGGQHSMLLYKPIYSPVFIGYQGEKVFSDFGVDLLFKDSESRGYKVTPVPALRVGTRF